MEEDLDSDDHAPDDPVDLGDSTHGLEPNGKVFSPDIPCSTSPIGPSKAVTSAVL